MQEDFFLHFLFKYLTVELFSSRVVDFEHLDS